MSHLDATELRPAGKDQTRSRDFSWLLWRWTIDIDADVLAAIFEQIDMAKAKLELQEMRKRNLGQG